jgi:DNA-binding transcriptional ArsR family regulator
MTHAINHWIRVEALAIFNEGEFSAGEIAEIIDEDVKKVTGHIKDLYESGCIEFAGYKLVGRGMRPVYRSTVRAVVSDEAYREMSVEDRHDLNGAVVQGLYAESVSSYQNGKMDADEELCFVWQALNLDAQGKRELLEHLKSTFEGAKEIDARAANRMAKSGETGTSTIVGLLGFERSRPGRPAGGYRTEKDER